MLYIIYQEDRDAGAAGIRAANREKHSTTRRRAARGSTGRRTTRTRSPGDPYPFQNGKNPYLDYLGRWKSDAPVPKVSEARSFEEGFLAGTTSIEAADEEGWVVSVTPSGGWNPACVAGNTGIGMSQRMQSFVLDPAEGPYNVLEPGKRPRVTLTPTLALKDGKPYLVFSVQGGDTQDQNLLQFFLNVVEFGMTVQEATEAPNINSYQMRSSFGAHDAEPGRDRINDVDPPWVRDELQRMGYKIEHGGQDLRPDQRDLTSTARTARCGADRATTARTTGSAGRPGAAAC